MTSVHLDVKGFVDAERFAGMSYRAANWIHVGRTQAEANSTATTSRHCSSLEVGAEIVEQGSGVGEQTPDDDQVAVADDTGRFLFAPHRRCWQDSPCQSATGRAPGVR